MQRDPATESGFEGKQPSAGFSPLEQLCDEAQDCSTREANAHLHLVPANIMDGDTNDAEDLLSISGASEPKHELGASINSVPSKIQTHNGTALHDLKFCHASVEGCGEAVTTSSVGDADSISGPLEKGSFQ